MASLLLSTEKLPDELLIPPNLNPDDESDVIGASNCFGGLKISLTAFALELIDGKLDTPIAPNGPEFSFLSEICATLSCVDDPNISGLTDETFESVVGTEADAEVNDDPKGPAETEAAAGFISSI